MFVCVCDGGWRVMVVRHSCVLCVIFWCLELCVFLFDCLLYTPWAQLRRGAQGPHYYYYYDRACLLQESLPPPQARVRQGVLLYQGQPPQGPSPPSPTSRAQVWPLPWGRECHPHPGQACQALHRQAWVLLPPILVATLQVCRPLHRPWDNSSGADTLMW